MKNKCMIILIVSVVMFVVQGCGKPEIYGNIDPGMEKTDVSKILSEPASFDGKTVKIEGKIITECPSGCWFDAGDGSRTIRVDIAPAGLAIPQQVGKVVVVNGKISVRDNQVKLLGEGVEIK